MVSDQEAWVAAIQQLQKTHPKYWVKADDEPRGVNAAAEFIQSARLMVASNFNARSFLLEYDSLKDLVEAAMIQLGLRVSINLFATSCIVCSCPGFVHNFKPRSSVHVSQYSVLLSACRLPSFMIAHGAILRHVKHSPKCAQNPPCQMCLR